MWPSQAFACGMGPSCPKLRLKVIHEKTSRSRAALIVDLPYEVCVWTERYCHNARPTLVLEQPRDTGAVFISASGTAADVQSINSHWKRIQRDSGVQWEIFTVKRLQRVFSTHVVQGVATALARLGPEHTAAVQGTARMMGKSVSTMERFYARSSAHDMANAAVRQVGQWRAAVLEEAGAELPAANAGAPGGSADSPGPPGGRRLVPAARFGRGRPPSQAVLALCSARRASAATDDMGGDVEFHREAAGSEYSEDSEGSEATASMSNDSDSDINIDSDSDSDPAQSAGQALVGLLGPTGPARNQGQAAGASMDDYAGPRSSHREGGGSAITDAGAMRRGGGGGLAPLAAPSNSRHRMEGGGGGDGGCRTASKQSSLPEKPACVVQ